MEESSGRAQRPGVKDCAARTQTHASVAPEGGVLRKATYRKASNASGRFDHCSCQ